MRLCDVFRILKFASTLQYFKISYAIPVFLVPEAGEFSTLIVMRYMYKSDTYFTSAVTRTCGISSDSSTLCFTQHTNTTHKHNNNNMIRYVIK